MEWIKLKDYTELEFSLADTGVQEYYSVWDNVAKKFLIGGEGIAPIQGSNGQLYKIEETKFLKAQDFKILFPNCAKSNKRIRNIVVNNVTYRASLPLSVNEAIEGLIKTAELLKQHSLSLKFKLTRTGKGLGTKYNVFIVDTGIEVKEQNNGIVNNEIKKPLVDVEKKELVRKKNIDLNDDEKELISKLKAITLPDNPFDSVFETFKQISDESRAKELTEFFLN